MREDVRFEAEGVTLAGWLYRPTGAAAAPAVVMAHGFSGVKEQGLDRYAEAFAAAGLCVLVFDHRNFGASGGEPRQEIDPVQQARDYRHAITYRSTLPDIDAGRIGIWGTSYSGGIVLHVAAMDRRVRAVVSQVPSVNGSANAARRVRPELLAEVNARFDADRDARFRGAAPAMIACVADDAGTPCVMPGKAAFDFFADSAAHAPAWRNEVTLRTLEMAREWDPGHVVARISPTPLLLIVAADDTLTPTDLALEAFERALQPKELLLVPGGHFDVYTVHFEAASRAARDWFARHLGAG